MSNPIQSAAPHGTRPPNPAPAPQEPPLGPRGILFGTVLLGVLLLGFALWANSAGRAAGAAAATPPELTLLSPTPGESVQGPLHLVFQTPVPLSRGPGGWEAGRFHIHAEIDGMEIMPGAQDIASAGPDRYRWTFAALDPGERRVRLFWSDARHREIEGASTPTITIEAR